MAWRMRKTPKTLTRSGARMPHFSRSSRAREARLGCQRSVHGGDGTIDVLDACLPVADGHTHTAHTPPSGAAKECFAGPEDIGDHLIRARVVIGRGRVGLTTTKTYQSLVDRGFPYYLRARERPNPRDEGARMLTCPINEVGDASTAELANGGIDR